MIGYSYFVLGWSETCLINVLMIYKNPWIQNNTEGLLCDTCKAGSFYNSEAHATGCLECVCMGITDQCDSTAQKSIQVCMPSIAIYMYKPQHYRPIRFQESHIALSAIPEGIQEHDKRWIFQTMYCFCSATSVHLGHCVIFSYALRWPSDMADDVVQYS